MTLYDTSHTHMHAYIHTQGSVIDKIHFCFFEF